MFSLLKLKKISISTTITFFITFISLLALFVIFSYYSDQAMPLAPVFIVMVFVLFIIEPFFTLKYSNPLITLFFIETYIFLAHFANIFLVKQVDYVFYLYFIPVLSAAVNFGILGSLPSAFFIYLLVFISHWINDHTVSFYSAEFFPQFIPLFITSLILGIMVEFRERLREKYLVASSFTKLLGSFKRMMNETDENMNLLLNNISEMLSCSGIFIFLKYRDKYKKINFYNDGLIDDREIEEKIGDICSKDETSIFFKNKKYFIKTHNIKVDNNNICIILLWEKEKANFTSNEDKIIEEFFDFISFWFNYENTKKKSRILQNYLETLIKQSPIGILVLDDNNKIIHTNRKIEDVFLYKEEEIINKILFKDVFLFEENINFSEINNKEIKVYRKDHSQIPCYIYYEEVLIEDLNEKRKIILIENLSEKKKLEETVNRKSRMELVGEMAAGLAHELRNPLGGIQGFVSMLKNHKDETIQKYALKLEKGINRISLLVEKFLDYAEKKSILKENIDIEKLIIDCCEEYSEQINSKNIDLKIESKSKDTVIADKNRLAQAIKNIISNSIDAVSEKDGQITITIEPGDEEAVISFSDNGIGIKKEIIEKITNPFFTTKTAGYGLGLNIVKKVIEDESHGQLEIESKEGVGTTIKMRLKISKGK